MDRNVFPAYKPRCPRHIGLVDQYMWSEKDSTPYKWIFYEGGNYWPNPINQGIASEIIQNGENSFKIYIYFAIKNDGTIYFLNSFDEDWEEQGKYLKEIPFEPEAE